MPISKPAGPAAGMAIVGRAVADLMPGPAAEAAAGGGTAPSEVTQPLQRFRLALSDIAGPNFLEKAVPVGWRYLLFGPESMAAADVKSSKPGDANFDSMIHGPMAERLAKAAEIAEAKYGASPMAFEARILEIPAVHIVALWLHGPHDIFIPFLEGGAEDSLVPQEDPSFLSRVAQAAAAKQAHSQGGPAAVKRTGPVNLNQALAQLTDAARALNDLAALLGSARPAVAPASQARGAEQGGSPEGLTADQKLICERIINAFETGSMQGDYGKIAIFADGPHNIRQITYGRSQTTEYGNLRELVSMYVEAGGAFSHDLRGYVDRIGRVALVDDSRFKDLLRQAGATDQIMRDTQDTFFDQRYFQPSRNWATTNGFTRALSALVIYDSYIHSGGILDLLRSRFPEPIPARGGNEQTWIQQYVAARNDWLLSSSNPPVRASAYRTRDLLREIGRGNWDLAMLPISANGVLVDARPLTAAAAGDAAGVPYFPAPAGWGDRARPAIGGAAATDDDPAFPMPGEADNLAGDSALADFGSDGALDFSPLAGEGSAGGPLLSLDLSAAQAFLEACRTSTPRVSYGLGKKVPFLGAVPGRDFMKVDCSGFVREALRRATSPAIAFPDGSVNQHDWVRAHGFAKSSVAAATQSDGFVRIAFLRPQDSPHRIGHVVLTAAAKTLESHGGVGPDSRPWTGADWQAKAFVYILARTASLATAAAAGGAAGTTYTVRTGRRYRATLTLSWWEQGVGNDYIQGKLQEVGFTNVVVSGSGATRYADGLWPGSDTTAPLDPHIVSVVELPAAAS